MEIGQHLYNKATLYNHSLATTLQTVVRLATTYYDDLRPFINYSLRDFFNFVAKDIKYEPDPPGLERVCRPGVTLKAGFGDCDDKTVVCLAFFILKNITCGYSIISNKKNCSYHHIFPFLIVAGCQYDYDATYARNKPYVIKTYRKRQDKIIYKGGT